MKRVKELVHQKNDKVVGGYRKVCVKCPQVVAIQMYGIVCRQRFRPRSLHNHWEMLAVVAVCLPFWHLMWAMKSWMLTLDLQTALPLLERMLCDSEQVE